MTTYLIQFALLPAEIFTSHHRPGICEKVFCFALKCSLLHLAISSSLEAEGISMYVDKDNISSSADVNSWSLLTIKNNGAYWKLFLVFSMHTLMLSESFISELRLLHYCIRNVSNSKHRLLFSVLQKENAHSHLKGCTPLHIIGMKERLYSLAILLAYCCRTGIFRGSHIHHQWAGGRQKVIQYFIVSINEATLKVN